MFVDLDWPTNASSPLSASAELLVYERIDDDDDDDDDDDEYLAYVNLVKHILRIYTYLAA